MKTYFQSLKEVYFFDALSDRDIYRIEEVCHEMLCDTGDVVIREGTEGDRFYIILEGKARVWKDYDSPERDLLAVCGPGQLFGELALIDDAPRSATVVAQTRLRLLSIGREDFNEIISGSPAISLSVMKSISNMVRRQTENFLERMRKGKHRLAKAYEQLRCEFEERKVLEARLRQAQKMEAVGTLAGGIAHNFNNLLQGIQGNASLLLCQTGPQHPYHRKLKNIESYVEAGGVLTHRILRFARSAGYNIAPADVNRILRKSIWKFGTGKKGLEILETYEEKVWEIAVNAEAIEQAMLNLYANAWEAMPGGGTLSLKTVNMSLDETQASPLRVKPGHYVHISVSDTGIGMDRAICHRIFDPFFTTKEMGNGTGLGLAFVYNVVKSYDGVIYAESEKGKGATFDIYLPSIS